MEEFKPLRSSTKIYSASNEWAWCPASFESFIEEYEHVSDTLSGPDRLVLYRGQRDHSWLLDSTIARSLKKNWFHVLPGHQFNAQAQESFELHRLLVSAALWKFAHVVRPSQELKAHAERIVELDLMFEMMKRYQQYPEREDDWPSVPGTPLVDWSRSKDIGLFFANRHRSQNQSGAVFILDATELGKVQMTKKVEEILRILELQMNDHSPGLPLLFCPPTQILMARAKRQEAYYFAHMDMRYDLAKIWRIHEQALTRRVLLKMILPGGSNDVVARYLDQKGLTEEFVMVDE